MKRQDGPDEYWGDWGDPFVGAAKQPRHYPSEEDGNFIGTPEQLARDLVDAVGFKDAITLITNTTRHDIVWFGDAANAHDYRRRLPYDVQLMILNAVDDGTSLRALMYTCKDWCRGVPAIMAKQQNILLHHIDYPMSDVPCIVYACEGLIVPAVANGRWAEKDQRYPIVISKYATLLVRALCPIKRGHGYCGTLGTMKVEIGRDPKKNEMFEFAFDFITTDLIFTCTFPMRTASRTLISEIYHKIKGTISHPEKPAGFCTYCGRKKTTDIDCKTCGHASTSRGQAYQNWRIFKK